MGLICQPSKFYISNTSAALISHSANPLIYGTKVILFSCLPWLDFLLSTLPFHLPLSCFPPLKMSCTQPSDKHQRAQIITCGSQRSQKSERRWGLSRPSPAPEFPAAASVQPWLDSVGLSEAWTARPNAGALWPSNLVSPNFTVIMKQSWAGSVNPTQTF